MIFQETKLAGACVIEVERLADERGFFAGTFDENEFAARGLKSRIVQSNISFNTHAGTLRGMHYQAAPVEQPKLVRCTRGSIYDVIIDLRPGSRTRFQWFGIELSAENRRMLYIPAGFAHGFQTLEDESEVVYEMFAPYAPDCARGVRWDDPAFAILWPAAERIINERDRSYADIGA